MAGRRLAISSLLCDDDSPPSSSATRPSPAPSPPKSLLAPDTDTVVLAPHLLRPRHDRHDQYRPEREQLGASSSNLYQQRESVRDFLPLSLQSTTLRRRTPPPDQLQAAQYTLDRQSVYSRHGKNREEPVITVPTQPLVSHRVDAFDPLAAERQGRPDLPRHQPTPYLPSPHHRLFPSPSQSEHLSPPRHLPPHPHSPTHSHRIHTPHSPIGRPTANLPLLQSNPSPSYFPQRPSASPLNHYHSSSPMAPPPQPIPYQSSPSPQYRRPSAPPESSPPTSSAYSPTLSRSIPMSMSTFPSALLNPVSPSMQSPLGGLEALVQAATEERRRISGEGAFTSERKTEGFRSSSSRSPDVPYRPLDPAPAQTLAPRHAHHSQSVSPITSHVFESRSAGEVTGRLDMGPDPRPPKRRRRSGSHSGNESIHAAQSSPFASSRPSPETHRPSVMPPKIETLVAPSPVQVQRKEWLEELTPINPHTRSGLASEDRGEPQPQKTDDVDAFVSSSRMPKSEERSPPAPSPAATAEMKPVQIAECTSRRLISPEVSRRPSPPAQRHESPSRPPLPDSTPPPAAALAKDHRMDEIFEATPRAPAPARSPVRTTSSVRAPSPARPEVVAPLQTPTLEQELEEVAGVVPEPNAMDVDVDGEIARELEEAAAVDTPPVDRRTEVVLNTATDVDDELLSLVGDTSSRSSAPSRPREKSQQAKVPKATPNVASTSSTIRHSFSKQDAGALPSFPPATAHPSLPSRAVSAALIKSERESMPPPPTTPGVKDMDAMSDRTGTPKAEDRPAVPAKKKAKPKQTQSKQSQPSKPKPKATGAAKSKAKITKDKDGAGLVAKGKKGSPFPAGTAAAVKKAAASARSRSVSVMPPGSIGPEAEQDKDKDKEAASADEDDNEAEDKLYCICKTHYDEDRVMIACDRCDEWYHTSCVHMPDLEIDLVDQFICPPCIKKNPGLSLRTTWKRRCLFGLKQRNPASPEACHKPSRGAFSKYCSDECGVKYMRMRINYWAEEGGDKERLWESVKNAEKREGVAVSAELAREQTAMDVDGNSIRNGGPVPGIVKPAKSKRDRELEKLHAKLDEVVQKREAVKKEMDIVLWREKVTEHAARRSEGVDECGWDQRLCFGEEDVAEFGAGVLESYEGGQSRDSMQVDSTNEGEWWCTGKKKCNRHAGWQKLRLAEVEYEKEMKGQALQKLTTREREIRKRIEDILDPKARIASFNDTSTTVPQKTTSLVEKSAPNGQVKTKPNGDLVKKGKKRKSAVT